MKKKQTILAVDDNKTNLEIINNILKDNYTVILASDGEEALKIVGKNKPELILLDLMMPGMDGRETFKKIREDSLSCNVPIIFLTADRNEDTEAECLDLGASDFITKPIVPQVLISRIEKTIKLEEYKNNTREKIEEKSLEAQNLALQAISTIANTIDAKDEYTNGHSRRVAYYSRAIAQRMGYDDKAAGHVYQSALLHDVGKIGVPDAILKKTGKLTDKEYAKIREHTNIGADILSDIDIIDYLSDGARYHHERYDGGGYPQGLKGEQIPIIGRIIAVADVFDAMTSRRCYKDDFDIIKAREHIEKNIGTKFDPDVCKAFLQLLDEGIFAAAIKDA